MLVPLPVAALLWDARIGLPDEPILSLHHTEIPDNSLNQRQDLSMLLHRLLFGSTQGKVNVLDAILPGCYHKLPINKLPILATAPTDFHVKNLFYQISDAQILRKMCESEVGAWINSKGTPWGDGFILLKLAKETNNCDMLALIVQSKRKASLEDREKPDIDLLDDYERIIWNHREEFLEQKIFPIFIYLTDAISVQGLQTYPPSLCFIPEENSTFLLILASDDESEGSDSTSARQEDLLNTEKGEKEQGEKKQEKEKDKGKEKLKASGKPFTLYERADIKGCKIYHSIAKGNTYPL